MKRKLAYGLLIVFTAAAAVTQQSQFWYFLLAFEIFFAAAMAVWVHRIVKKLKISLALSDQVMQKGGKAGILVRITNRTGFPVGEVRIRLGVRDIQSGGQSEVWIHTGADRFGTDSWQTEVTPAHCGVLELSVLETRIFDYLGLWSARGKNLPGGKLISVLPQVHPEEFPEKLYKMQAPDGAEAELAKTQNDTQEVFDTRLFQRGDTLRTVHWKLSAKENDLLVKEFSRSADQAQLIIADSACEHPERVTAAQRDRFLEQVAAFAAGILKHRRPCEILWYSSAEQAPHIGRAESEEELYRVLEELLGALPYSGGGELAGWLEEHAGFVNGEPFTVTIEENSETEHGDTEQGQTERPEADIAYGCYVPDGGRPQRRRAAVLVPFFMLSVFTMLFAGLFLSAFDITVSLAVLAAAVFGMSVFFTWFYLEDRLKGYARILAALFVLLLYGAVCFVLQERIERGFCWIADTVIRRINFVYDGNFSLFHAGTQADAVIFLLIVLFPLNAVLAAGIVRRQHFGLVFAVLFPVLAVPAAAGGSPDAVWMYLLAMGLFILFAASRSLLPGWRIGVSAGVVALCVFLPAWGAMHASEVLPFDGISKKAARVETRLLQSVWNLFPQISGGRLQMSLEGVGGGVENGVLGAVDGYYFSGVETLRVTSSQKPPETVYLRGYVGEEYTGNSFEAGNEERFRNASVLWKTEGDPSVYMQNLPFLRMMYYENFGAEQTGQEGRKAQEGRAGQAGQTGQAGQEHVGQTAAGTSGLQTTANTISVENLNANTAYTYVPYLSFLNDNYQIFGGDGYAGGQTLQDDVFPCYWRSRYKEVMEAKRDTDKSKGILNQVEGQYRAYCEQNALEVPEKGLERLKAECGTAVLENDWNLEESAEHPAWEIAEEIEEIRHYILKKLMTSCSFEMDVDALPEGEDFVEYFLYQTKTGYSMHFAAAATMMFRLCGVPARYVVGYVAPQELFTENEDGSWSAVLQDDNAHAWTEIYQPFLGWTPVEVTPGMEAELSEGYYTQEDSTEQETEEAATESETDPLSDADKFPLQKIREYFQKNRDRLAAIALGAMAAILLLQLVNRIRKAKRLRLGIGLEPEKRMIALYRSIYRLLLCCGMPEEYSITGDGMLLDYLAQTCRSITEKDRAVLEKQILWASYGNAEMTQEDAEQICQLYRKCRRELSRRLSIRQKIRYFTAV